MKKHFPSFTTSVLALSVLATGACAQKDVTPSNVSSAVAPKTAARVLAATEVPRSIAPRDLMSDTWIATDALGRVTPLGGQGGARVPQRGKVAAIFYYVWHSPDAMPAIHDITKLLAANPNNPAWGPNQAFHWWGEPEAGYFHAEDPWVIRRNMSMLSDAGMDVIFFDVTNGFTYLPTVTAICETLRQMRREGNRTPQIAFLASSRPGATQTELYREFYSKKLYSELWFKWEGKPIILGLKNGKNDDGSEMPAEVKNFFTWRHSWAWSFHDWYGDGRGKWPWLDHTPQKPGLSDEGKVEQIVVETAQHPPNNMGKSFAAGVQPPTDEVGLTTETNKGPHFAEQWKRALEVDPPVVFLTQWNEWLAQRFVDVNGTQPFIGKPAKAGGTFFVDVYNAEYNRDIEPMKGGWGDNYYYQMVGGLRNFKGARPVPMASVPLTVKVDGNFKSWSSVRPEFRDTAGDTVHRNFGGATKSLRYVNTTGRNDIVTAKVARDAKNFSFYARTRSPLSPSTDKNWMQLFIDADQNGATGWHGYDFAVFGGNASTRILRRYNGTKWVAVARISFAMRGNELELSVPRASVPTKSGNFDCHWTDNASPTDIADWFVSGDSAPNRRFNYRYLASRN